MKTTLSMSAAAAFAATLLSVPVLRAQEADAGTGTATATADTAANGDEQPAAKEAPPVAMVRLSGAYRDLPEAGGDLTSLLTGTPSKPKAFFDLVEQLRDLTVNDHEHVLFDLSGSFSLQGAFQVAELERVMKELKAAGLETWAYLENGGNLNYQIAALCDHVILADLGGVELSAPAMSTLYMKDAFDFLGVQTDIVRCGDFKGAVEPYMLSRMSEHLRAHYVAMLDSINRDVTARIAKGRGMSAAQVREVQKKVLFTAGAAKDAGLVDHVVAWRGAKDALKQVTGIDDLNFVDALEENRDRRPVNPLTMLTQLFNPKDDEATEVEADSIVVLHLQGTIIDGTAAQAGSIVSGPTVRIIRSLIDDADVKGVVVRINSPGGSATASEAILLALRDLSATKPVVMSMGSLAASGGYYVTCIGRPILAEVSTITGSIGVFGMRPSFGPLMRRIGIHEEIVALDETATMMSLTQVWTDEQKSRVQASVNQIYDTFVNHVARSRGMTAGEVLGLAGGRVWSGQQAVENGLVDRIGGLHDAIAMVATEAGIEGLPEITHLPKPKSFLDSLAASMSMTQALLPDPAQRALAARVDLDQALSVLLHALEADRPTQVWAMMPATLNIR